MSGQMDNVVTSKNYIFIEDRDSETGHGWRDDIALPWARLVVNKCSNLKNGHICFSMEYMQDEEWYESSGVQIYPNLSYAWICEEDFFYKNKCIDDTFRQVHLISKDEKFLGINNMEGHFEFDMTPKEMREYLISLGIKERKFPRHS